MPRVTRSSVPVVLILAGALVPGCASALIEDHLLPPSTEAPADGSVEVTFLGTTTLLFDDGQTRLLIDGFLTRPSLLQFTTSEIQTDTAVVDAALLQAGIGSLDAIFVAHSHYDHALDVAYVAQKTGAHLHGSESTLNIARGGGLAESRMSLHATGVDVAVGLFTVTVLASRHSPPVPGINDDLGEVIAQPLVPPAPFADFVEGGSFDFLIRHGVNSILVKPSANFLPGALSGVHADVLFLGTGGLGHRIPAMRRQYYDETVGKVGPELVIPIHWDEVFEPLSDELEAGAGTTAAFDFLIERLADDGIEFGILQGYQSVLLFDT